MMCLISANRILLVSKGCIRAWLLHAQQSPVFLVAGCLSLFACQVTAHWVTPGPCIPQLTKSQ